MKQKEKNKNAKESRANTDQFQYNVYNYLKDVDR